MNFKDSQDYIAPIVEYAEFNMNQYIFMVSDNSEGEFEPGGDLS